MIPLEKIDALVSDQVWRIARLSNKVALLPPVIPALLVDVRKEIDVAREESTELSEALSSRAECG